MPRRELRSPAQSPAASAPAIRTCRHGQRCADIHIAHFAAVKRFITVTVHQVIGNNNTPIGGIAADKKVSQPTKLL